MRKGTLKKALALALTGAVLVGAFAGCGAKYSTRIWRFRCKLFPAQTIFR